MSQHLHTVAEALAYERGRGVVRAGEGCPHLRGRVEERADLLDAVWVVVVPVGCISDDLLHLNETRVCAVERPDARDELNAAVLRFLAASPRRLVHVPDRDREAMLTRPDGLRGATAFSIRVGDAGMPCNVGDEVVVEIDDAHLCTRSWMLKQQAYRGSNAAHPPPKSDAGWPAAVREALASGIP
jgi:hypothetical protein